jgi:hypothetical protein
MAPFARKVESRGFLSHGVSTLGDMNEADRISAMEFATMARTVAQEARSKGLRVPGFRTPPHVLGTTRSVQRLSGGNAVVSVATKGRDRRAVYGDLVEGVVVMNSLRGGMAKSVHRTLLQSVLATSPRAA